MGLRTTLMRCQAVEYVPVPVERRTDQDVLNMAVAEMLRNPTQLRALAILCRQNPLLKPFVLATLRSYAALA
jgi:hypothetical protein